MQTVSIFQSLTALAVVMPLLGAASPTADPLDAALQACLAKPDGETTVGMLDCTQTAIHGWDKRLNEAYQRALAALDPASRDLLRQSQRQWLAFREVERKALGGPWRGNSGTLAGVMASNAVLSAIKERVEELRVYLGGA